MAETLSKFAWANRVARFMRSQGLPKTGQLVKLAATPAYADARDQFRHRASFAVVHAMLCEAMEQAGLDHGKATGPREKAK